ncbi:MAG TPA: carboxypeptidase-like regulatory domain-containing protein, partial [Microlunatus sp.]
MCAFSATIAADNTDIDDLDFTIASPVLRGIGGTVSDQDGKPVPDTTVTLISPEGDEVVASTGDDGTYTFAELPPDDDYVATVTPPGSRDLRRRGEPTGPRIPRPRR